MALRDLLAWRAGWRQDTRAFRAVRSALGLSGYLGGKLTYRYDVRVATELTQADGYMTADTELAGGHRAPRPHRN